MVSCCGGEVFIPFGEEELGSLLRFMFWSLVRLMSESVSLQLQEPITAVLV